MEAGDNPYNPGAGTPPPEMAGRDDILRRAKNTIALARKNGAAKSLMLLGLRGVGKTVLLNRIDQIAEGAGCKTAMFEASARKPLAGQITPQLHQLLLQLDRGKNLSERVGPSGRATGNLETVLTKLLISIGEASQLRNTVAVLLVDEVQLVSKKDLGTLVMALHKISQRKLPLLMFGAGLPQLAGIMGNTKSYAERLFDCPEIGRLDDDSARQALVEPAKRRKVDYDEGAVSTILEATEGYPFFLQLWGFYAWEAALASPITGEDAREATKRATATLYRGFFRVRLDRLENRQRDYVRAMAEVMAKTGPRPSTTKEVEALLDMSPMEAGTIRRGVIEKGMVYSPNRGRIAFTVPRFDEFMRDAWGLRYSKRKTQPKISRRPKKRVS